MLSKPLLERKLPVSIFAKWAYQRELLTFAYASKACYACSAFYTLLLANTPVSVARDQVQTRGQFLEFAASVSHIQANQPC